MKNLLLIGAMGLALAGLSTPQAQAGPYIVTLTQQGSNVVATGSGAIDLSGFDLAGSATGTEFGTISFLDPSLGRVGTGYFSDQSSSTVADVYYSSTPFYGPQAFGNGPETSASGSSGDVVWFFPSPITEGAQINVPTGYVSDSALSNSATWDSTTFASLGVTPGTYMWTWGTGADQSFTLDVQGSTPPSAPEPSSLALLGAGLLGLVFLRRRKAA